MRLLVRVSSISMCTQRPYIINLQIQRTLQSSSLYNSAHFTIQLTLQFSSPYNSAHYNSAHFTIQRTLQSSAPYNSAHLTIQRTLQFSSPYNVLKSKCKVWRVNIPLLQCYVYLKT